MKEITQKLYIQYLQVNVTTHKGLWAFRIFSFVYQLSTSSIDIINIENNTKLQTKYICYGLEAPLYLKKNWKV